jgi:hypothetical protein
MDNLFYRAAREKLRFDYGGQISCEDLFDLSVEQLDTIYKALRFQQVTVEDESLLRKVTKEMTLVNLRADIVRYIVEIKLDEVKQRELSAQRKQQKAKIAAIIEKKKDEGLESMSLEELQKTMAELEH